jgi:hypothetical protein
MKITALKTLPAREESYVAEIHCDLCGRISTNAWRPWSTGSYDLREVEVSLRTGDQYPEGGGGEMVEFDICPDCFTNKLVVWLESQGAKPRIEPWDT